ncbi:hypothetical protein QFZ66_000046 [Streptomyces sp. B4I13]|uniref:hypothetical protein n=1 Tax=Streptomyces sp. B4I13 TaxID=3042271 RepID=UPI002788882C|nr:hypothetical protein [Streptomyces sp. B4I13]MDQ0956168.1 hypothetical protein [Streptomyces sp. B4I13]
MTDTTGMVGHDVADLAESLVAHDQADLERPFTTLWCVAVGATDLDYRTRTRSGCSPSELVVRLLERGHVESRWATADTASPQTVADLRVVARCCETSTPCPP